MSVTSSAPFFLFFVVAVVFLAAVVPSVRAADIVACNGVSSGAWDSDYASAGGARVHSWGSSTSCYGSRVTALPKVKSFTFWVRQDSGSATASGLVIDADSNLVLASVDISELLPTTTTYISVTAEFESMVSLDASKTYVLAFCVTDNNGQYSMDAIESGDSFRYCNGYDVCTTEGTSWQSYNSATLRSNIAGDCTPSSATQLAAPQWAGALTRAVALLTALLH